MIFISEEIARMRKKAGLTQPQLVKKLSKYGISTTPSTISKWENGGKTPDAYEFITLCDIYDIRDVLKTFMAKPDPQAQTDILEPLNQEGREFAAQFIEFLSADPSYSYIPMPHPVTEISKRTIMLYDMPVSAGSGIFLDSDDYELIEVDGSVPMDATFALRVKGGSMRPRFEDGQIIYIRRQPSVENNEIGIFLLNGDAYCKVLSGNALVSLNPEYAPIEIKEHDELRVFGKVLG